MRTHVETKVVRFKVSPENCRTFSDPNELGRKRYFAQIPVDEIHRARIDYGPNPRNQNMETKVAEAIRESLKNEGGWFMYYNKGIVLNAESAEYDNKTETLSNAENTDDADGTVVARLSPYRQFLCGRATGFRRCFKFDSRSRVKCPAPLAPSRASRKSTCFLKVSTLATCTCTLSPSRIIAARAPADQLVARRVEHIKIVLQHGQMHQPAHRQPGHIHEETEIAHVSHQRRIRRAARPDLQLRLQEGDTTSHPCCRARRRRNCVRFRKYARRFP